MSKIRDLFKINRKTFFDPTGWVGYETIKSQHQTLRTVLRSLFTSQKATRTETFEAALVRQNLTEQDIELSRQSYRRAALILALIGLILFLYAFYLLFRYFTITGWLLGLSAAAILFSQAFKFDFWALQIKRRSLGLTFQDWKNNLLSDEGKLNGK